MTPGRLGFAALTQAGSRVTASNTHALAALRLGVTACSGWPGASGDAGPQPVSHRDSDGHGHGSWNAVTVTVPILPQSDSELDPTHVHFGSSEQTFESSISTCCAR